jgi:TonB family protein
MKALLVLFSFAVAASPALAQRPSRNSDFQSAKIIQTVQPVFPESLIVRYRNGGEVRVAISVDANGKLGEWLVISYTDREFADAAVAAFKEWEFEPARMMGEPIPVHIELTFNFEVKGVVVSLTPAETTDVLFNSLLSRQPAYAPCTLRELDRIPVPLNTVKPAYPKELGDRGVQGAVTVEFFIDEQGAVRMPFVVGRPPIALADLAVDAVRLWKFEPPTRHGRPVLVHVRQVFTFTPTSVAQN